LASCQQCAEGSIGRYHDSVFGRYLVEDYNVFCSLQAARRFEKHLKSGSGRAFSTRHFGA
jgi:hypothetical protein